MFRGLQAPVTRFFTQVTPRQNVKQNQDSENAREQPFGTAGATGRTKNLIGQSLKPQVRQLRLDSP